MFRRDALRARPSVTVVVALAGLLAACGGEPEVAEDHGVESGPAWTPSSSDLVFVSNRDGNANIYLLRAGSSEWVQLTDDPAADNWPVWSPDGSRIAFQSRRNGKLDIFVMNADGSGTTRLTDDPEHDYLPSWSPDGTQIAFASWRREEGDGEAANHIYVMEADGSGQRRLFAESPGTSTGVAWLADGERFLLARKTSADGADIFLVDGAGEELGRLTDSAAYDGAPELSPDGSRVAVYSAAGELSALAVMGLDGSERRVVVGEGRSWYPRWSPDGSWLVYTASISEGDADFDVMAVPLFGDGAPVSLVSGPGRESEGSWRPVGGAGTQ